MTEKSFKRIKRALRLSDLSDASAMERIQELVGTPDEISILQNPRIKEILGDENAEREIAQRFRPPGPATSRALLSNYDIDGILYHYALAFRGFMPISYGMIDFKSYDSHLSELSIAKMLKGGFDCAGCVINTDTHSGHGKHWICVFIDCRLPIWTVESFNSSGKPPRAEILAWMEDIEQQFIAARQEMNKSLIGKTGTPKTERVLIYGIQHQHGNSECGVYALYYIWSRIHKVDPHLFFTRIIPDDEIAGFRTYLFRGE